ncbi:MAG TPA: phosphoadenosine phosphosulfate reductase family protein [Chitinophagales bacterium]|nr:phosphoadenosine phosphosulfate reductase family protein [Chitinophagales bacterium]
MIKKITELELNQRIKWNLYQKIDHALGIIEHFIQINPDAVVSFSGGIDSTVLLKLVRMVKPDVKGVFGNTTNEHSEILRFVRTIENIETLLPNETFIHTVEKHGFPLISKKIAKMVTALKHPNENNEAVRNLYLTGITREGRINKQWKLPLKWHFLIDVPFDITNKCCDILKKNTLSKFDKQGVFVGTMTSDSKLRRQSYLQTGCIDEANNKCKPISIFTKQDIWDFVKMYNLLYCDVYDKGETNTGCAYCGFGCHLEKESRFERLKLREPKRYEQMMNLRNNGITYNEAIQTALKKPMRAGKKIFNYGQISIDFGTRQEQPCN